MAVDAEGREDSSPEKDGEHRVFVKRLQGTRPIATYAILACIAAVFALELAWGGSKSTAVLARMGALMRERVLDGQWWRLMSSGVLHADVTHVALNAYVLWALGNTVERLLQSYRFLILYVTSGVVAALGSAVFLGQLSVGASGAIWGLLGAQAAFAFGAHGYVSRPARAMLQKAAAINLGINVLNSFRPHVDWAAHFTGGAAGAALVASGVLLRGLPKLVSPSTPRPELAKVRWLAAALSAIYALGAGIGVVSGKAWELGRPPSYVVQELPELGVRVRVPALLGAPRLTRKADELVYTFGDESGPLLVTLNRVAFDPPIPEAKMQSELSELRKQMAETDEVDGVEPRLVVAPETRLHNGRHVTRARFEYATGATYDSVNIVEPRLMYDIAVIAWPDFAQRYSEVAAKVSDSLAARGEVVP
jgi:membrane associated rhomboid family serine protease